MQETVKVIIPIYKVSLSTDEYISLRQSISVLSKYSIVLVCPKSLNISNYISEYNNFQVERFDDSFFESIDGYNKLMMSRQFYKRFLDNKYILIYQLDAYVFRDELEYWCSLDYDYIGAPWFEGYDFSDEKKNIMGVGNGGFSLRKVQSHYTALKYRWIHLIFKNFYESISQTAKSNQFNLFSKTSFFLKAFLCRFSKKKNDRLKTITINEDGYWSFIVPKINFNFKIAPIADALKFSFEAKPEVLYKMNHDQLPFGCHAWAKYNRTFWNQFIN